MQNSSYSFVAPEKSFYAIEPVDISVDYIRKLTDAGRYEDVISIFESSITIRPIENPWIFYIIIDCYQKLGHPAAAFLSACIARDNVDLGEGTSHTSNTILSFLQHTESTQVATRVFKKHLLSFGEPVWEADLSYSRQLLHADARSPAPISGRVDTQVTEESQWSGWTPDRLFGGKIPDSLDDLKWPQTRRAISVALIPDGQLIVSRGNIVVFDSNGTLIDDLSVTEYRGFLHDTKSLTHWRYRNAPHMFAVHEADEVVLISDCWTAPNICHFLLDQAPRAELYARAGVNISQALVIGPDLKTDFQKDILKAIGITRYLGITEPALIKAKRLYISTDCSDAQVSGNLGSGWTQDFLRRTLQRPRLSPRRLLISRRDSGRRRIMNEDALMERLSPIGFERISLGEHSLADQIQVFSDATHIIGPHGAGMALQVFCDPGTEVAEVFHPQYSNAQIAMQARQRGIRYTALVGLPTDETLPQTDFISTQYADMTLDFESLEQWILETELSKYSNI